MVSILYTHTYKYNMNNDQNYNKLGKKIILNIEKLQKLSKK